MKVKNLIEAFNPRKISSDAIDKSLHEADALVLCKGELFFQTNEGETLASIYPVGDEVAMIIAVYFDKPIMSA